MTIAEWRLAAATDQTLRPSGNMLKKLSRFELKPSPYSRRRLFHSMLSQEPVLFGDFPLRYTLQPFFQVNDLPGALKKLFLNTPKTLTRLGKTKQVRYLPVEKVVDKWQDGRSVFSANDIFFRNAGLHRIFDCSAISDFSIIPDSPPEINFIEVATLLMGTPGCMTDSHSDDPDGCNYCIRGKKLWFVWDRKEGRQYGLEDCEYDDVYTQAGFSLASFVKLRTANWFTVAAGQTLFLPGNLTHKVITLEKYLGISSFYLGLVNALCTLSRWKFNGTVMVTEPLQEQLTSLLLRQLEETAAGSRTDKHQWGFYHLQEALRVWQRRYSSHQRDNLCSDPGFRMLVEKMSMYSRFNIGRRNGG